MAHKRKSGVTTAQEFGARMRSTRSSSMNNSTLSGKWKEIKGEVMKTWGELTSDEVDRTQGNAQSLVGLLEQKFGMAKDEASKKINDLIAKHSDQMNSKIDKAKDSLRDDEREDDFH
jgi:uncharacterized protein YjbJ (UPF0337 family)